jgi:hypothetical protein
MNTSKPGAASRRHKYQIGDAFAVPLRDSGYAVGVVARVDPKGKILLAYFFGPRHRNVPRLTQVTGLSPRDSIMVARCGDRSLIDGDWPIIGNLSAWAEEPAPLPDFVRLDAVDGKRYVVRYDGNNLALETGAVTVSAQEAQDLPPDGLNGGGAIEIKLTRLLGGAALA